MDFEKFLLLTEHVEKSHEQIYLVGGYVRDYLLNKESSDCDLTTTASPALLCQIFPDCNKEFIKYGFVRINFLNEALDIASLREEEYIHRRKPAKITFIKDLKLDSNRRDFTINSLYMDKNKNIYDYHFGIDDLKNRIVRIIGSYNRYDEDPLRLIRGIRFTYQLGFSFLPEEKKYVQDHLYLLNDVSFFQVEKEYQKLLHFIDKETLKKDYDFSDVVLSIPKNLLGQIVLLDTLDKKTFVSLYERGVHLICLKNIDKELIINYQRYLAFVNSFDEFINAHQKKQMIILPYSESLLPMSSSLIDIEKKELYNRKIQKEIKDYFKAYEQD